MDLILILIHRQGDNPDWLARARSTAAQQGVPLLELDGTGVDILSNTRRLLRAATADYVARIDSDDWLPDGAVGLLQSAHEEEPGLGCYFTDEAHGDASGRLISGSGAVRELITDVQCIETDATTAHHLVAWRRELAVAASGIPNIGPYSPWVISAACAKWGGFRHAPGIGYVWRRHAAGSSKTYPRQCWINAHELIQRLPESPP